MTGVELLAEAAGALLDVYALLYLFLGMLVGLFFGAVPGLGGTTALVMLTPLTFALAPIEAIYLAGGVMGATSFGGSIPAILLNVPGTAPNYATTLDGHPLARQGKAGMAIGASAAASALGGLFGLGTLLLVLPFARDLVLSLGPAEIFLLMVLALTTISAALPGDGLKTLISGGAGLMLAFVGSDRMSGDLRFDFGSEYLWDGVPLLPVLTGIFALAPVLVLAMTGRPVTDRLSGAMAFSDIRDGVTSVFRNWPVLIRGSVIGTMIGALPGLGGTVASIVSYLSARRASPTPEIFGTGTIIGVIAPESANNAKDGGSLLPTLAFGIPGSAETSVFLGILILHGIEPGPLMLIEQQGVVFGLIAALTVSAVGASIIGLLFSRWLLKVANLEAALIAPVVTMIALAAVYVSSYDMRDVAAACVIAVAGILMMRHGYSRICFVVAFMVGPDTEISLRQTILISGGDPLDFWMSRPQSVLLILLIVATLAILLWRNQRLGRN
ncbi:MAG: tripartite tricarboxylate transporter permease [Silicimonas sp.]|nr:tripartite tricarboxylate transporter permease [Silicimonas sp.]